MSKIVNFTRGLGIIAVDATAPAAKVVGKVAMKGLVLGIAGGMMVNESVIKKAAAAVNAVAEKGTTEVVVTSPAEVFIATLHMTDLRSEEEKVASSARIKSNIRAKFFGK